MAVILNMQRTISVERPIIFVNQSHHTKADIKLHNFNMYSFYTYFPISEPYYTENNCLNLNRLELHDFKL